MTWAYSRIETDCNGNTYDHLVQPGANVDKDIKVIPRGATIHIVDHEGRKSFCELDLPIFVILHRVGLNTDIIIEADLQLVTFPKAPRYFRAGLVDGWMLHVFNYIDKPSNPDFFKRRNHNNLKEGPLV